MKRLRSILADRSSASAVLVLGVLLLLLQTVVSGAVSVAHVATAVGGEPRFVICAPLSPTGVRLAPSEDGVATDVHCPLCRITAVTCLPIPFNTADLGPAFVLELSDGRPAAADEVPPPQLFALKLAPDRTGPPTDLR